MFGLGMHHTSLAQHAVQLKSSCTTLFEFLVWFPVANVRFACLALQLLHSLPHLSLILSFECTDLTPQMLFGQICHSFALTLHSIYKGAAGTFVVSSPSLLNIHTSLFVIPCFFLSPSPSPPPPATSSSSLACCYLPCVFGLCTSTMPFGLFAAHPNTMHHLTRPLSSPPLD
jgi:hypothetical protein